jgi:hypothetical protein
MKNKKNRLLTNSFIEISLQTHTRKATPMTNLRISATVSASSKKQLREAGKQGGLKGVALERFCSSAGHAVEYSVDPRTGEAKPVRIDGAFVLHTE